MDQTLIIGCLLAGRQIFFPLFRGCRDSGPQP